MDTVFNIDHWFAEDGIIAGVKPGFSPREGQAQLSDIILQETRQGNHTISEGPTGFGKSFALLVPSIIHVLESGSRVVISTETKNLQDQYAGKDVPLLQQACASQGSHFSFAVAKGKGNFLCRSAADVYGIESAFNPNLRKWVKSLNIFSDSGDSSTISDFEFTPKEWSELGANEMSPCETCEYYGGGTAPNNNTECFYFKARNKVKDAQIVVSNHTLTLLDAQLGAGTILGEYDTLIVDEAHSFAEKATDTWGEQLKSQTISYTMSGIARLLEKANFPDYDSVINADGMTDWREVEKRIFEPFSTLAEARKSMPVEDIPQNILTKSKAAADEIIESLSEIQKNVTSEMTGGGEAYEMTPIESACRKASERISKLKGTIKAIYGEGVLEEFKDNWLAYLDFNSYVIRGREHYDPVLNLKPIEVAPLMRTLIFGAIRSVHLISATMQTCGSFNFMKRSLGCPDNTTEYVGPSPFNFYEQVAAYYPVHMPAPPKDMNAFGYRQQSSEYFNALSTEIVKLIRYMEGSVLVLFTNSAHMREVHSRVDDQVGYQCLLQGGGMTNPALVEIMKTDEKSCLFATKSFFSGIDIPGDALRCVALTKAPFPNTFDPLFKARIRKIKERGGNDFTELSMPLMIAELKQAYGRLIRTTTDEGVFAFLDSSIMDKSYFRTMEAALPKMKKYRKL